MNIRRQIRLWLVAVGLLVLSACAQPQQPLAFTTKTTQDFANLIQQGDAEKVSMMYTEDTKLMPPGEPVIEGRVAVRYFLQDLFDQQGLPIELDERDRFVAGDYAYRDGILIQHLKDGNTRIGKFMQLWKYDHGTWKQHRSMWNTSAPLPADAPANATAPLETSPAKKKQ